MRLHSSLFARGAGAATALLLLASCDEGAPAPSQSGYFLMTDASELAPLSSGLPAVRGSDGVEAEAFLVGTPVAPDTDYVPPACLGSSTTTFSGDHMLLDWHCTTSPYRVVADLAYIGDTTYGGIAFVNVVTDADEGSLGVYTAMVALETPCVSETPSNCVPDLPYGDAQQLPEHLYTLTSAAPEIVETPTITVRYEDQWTPLRCDGTTSWHPDLAPGPAIRLKWNCVYRLADGTRVGSAGAPAFWNGTLVDRDGDGTYEGNLIVDPLTSMGTVGDAVIVPFTLTSP